MKETFYSNGKLLLTGEYLVLDGARALALPTKFGQDMTVRMASDQKIQWKSFDSDGSIWFEDTITFEEIRIRTKGESSIKSTLIDILHEASRLNPDFFNSNGYSIETQLTFPKFWGLGTSSTLINNIAQWLKIDAFLLLKNSFGGSGYDIAAAQNNSPVVYRLENGNPVTEPVVFTPSFTQNLYFVYLNRKQSSKAAIASYYNNSLDGLSASIEAVNKITEQVLAAQTVGAFAHQLEKHENLLSSILEMQTVRETFFPDFIGTIKSLGGWGGDFILAVSKDNPEIYFKEKGFHTVIPYDAIILK
ncbi:MAG TPA: GYDIA family GHMP kinase [Flavobacterium sp.]|jgi:mevalonate kinase